MTAVDARNRALLDLLRALEKEDYRFVTPTPATHERVLRRDKGRFARDLRDIFGWNLPFGQEAERWEAVRHLRAAGEIAQVEDGWKSLVRVASLGGRLFLHSAYPTEEEDAVFFGPDSYRFADFVLAELGGAAGVRRLVDLGAGSGVGAISAAPALPGARLTLVDSNPAALRLATLNAAHAGIEVELIRGRGLAAVSGEMDLIIANPPFIMDSGRRTYRDGGGMHGAELSIEWGRAAVSRLMPGGRMLLYTGTAIIDGRDPLRDILERELPILGGRLRYREIDPDIFGEELEEPAYASVERIAAVGAVIERVDS